MAKLDYCTVPFHITCQLSLPEQHFLIQIARNEVLFQDDARRVSKGILKLLFDVSPSLNVIH